MQFTSILTILAVVTAVVAVPPGINFPEKRVTCSLPNGDSYCLGHCVLEGFCDSYCNE